MKICLLLYKHDNNPWKDFYDVLIIIKFLNIKIFKS